MMKIMMTEKKITQEKITTGNEQRHKSLSPPSKTGLVGQPNIRLNGPINIPEYCLIEGSTGFVS
jgi:hypothetical protein